MQVQRGREGRQKPARVVKVTGIRKIDEQDKDGATLELYLTAAHASAEGSIRSESTESLPTFFHGKKRSLLFFKHPHSRGGEERAKYPI